MEQNPVPAEPAEAKKTYAASVAIVGSPNTGKSTLLNRILGRKVSIVSDKPQTTETRILGVLTRGDRQILFNDTPGIGKPKGERAARINRIAAETSLQTDFILFVLDAKRGLGPNDEKILKSLEETGQPVIAVLNKMDLTNPYDAIPVAAQLQARRIDEIVPVSALNGDNVEKLVELILARAPENPHLYGAHETTDQPPEFTAAEFIREQIFLNADKEIPYNIRVDVETFEDKGEEGLTISARIMADNPRHRMILIGKGGAFVRNVRLFATKRLKEYFKRKVALTLTVKAKKATPGSGRGSRGKR